MAKPSIVPCPKAAPEIGLQMSVWLVEEGLTAPDTLTSLLEELLVPQTAAEVTRFPDRAALPSVNRPLHPTCVIASVDKLSSDTSSFLRAASRRVAVIATSADCSAARIVRCARAGASEFLEQPYSQKALARCVSAALAHDRRSLEEHTRLEKIKGCYTLLTPREREVLPLLTNGLLNKQAASVLGISLVTLQIHRGNVMRKMKASSFAELVRASVMLEAARQIPILQLSPSHF